MEVSTVQDPLGHTLKVIGDVDASSSILLDNAIGEALHQSEGDVFVDCTELDYISSPGIGVFTSRLHECDDSNRKIILYGVNNKVLNVFKILGLHQLLPIYSTKKELISAIANDSKNQG